MYQMYQDMVQSATSRYSYNRRLVVRRLYLHWLVMLVMCALFIALLVDSHFLHCAERNFQFSVLKQSLLLRDMLQDMIGLQRPKTAILGDQVFLSELLQSYAMMPGLDVVDVLGRDGTAYGLSALRGIALPRGGDWSRLQYQIFQHHRQLSGRQPYWVVSKYTVVIVGLPVLENNAADSRWFIFLWSRAATKVWHTALPVICGAGLLVVLLLFLPGLVLSLPPSAATVQLQRNRINGFAALELTWRRMRSAQTKLLHLEVL